ncbi:MAG TPA: bifunctional precorrin-2 dehydrogenase/sirohydrochlorin ferrochelatase [Dehalococcoidia bacterium]|jgi:precorrin-2 dehydrogenase/sirohydrochlorin ferrochelatase|nr:bifunctional precorrin-2 dehydrogenase/sirohydrochlorin ferrochelatase [Dehalococcoidia bacterium]
MALYPIFIETKGRRVIVIGGGHVGAEKVRGLLAGEADITVVSPELIPELQEHTDAGRIAHIARAYRESDLDDGYEFVMVATDDGAINAEVSAAGKRRGIWVNAADDPKNCDFILPSVVRKGKITLAASTAGASPALARRLREELDAYLTEDMPALADLLAEVRQEVRQRGIKIENDTWQEAIDEQLRVLLAQRKYVAARARLVERLGIELAPAAAGDA